MTVSRSLHVSATVLDQFWLIVLSCHHGWQFLAFFRFLVIFDWILDIVSFTLLSAGYFCINGSQLMVVWLTIFWFYDFTMVQKQYTRSRNCTLNFEFWPSPWLAIPGTVLSCDAGQWQRAIAPMQPHNHKDKWLILRTFLFFTFSIIVSKLYEILNTLL